MNRETIIQMARKAGFLEGKASDRFHLGCYIGADVSEELLERFAAAIRAATKEEDARICEQHAKLYSELDELNHAYKGAAFAIRESK